MRYRLVAFALVLLFASGPTRSSQPDHKTSDSESRVSTEELVKKGNSLFDNDDYDSAVKAFTRALEQDPTNGAAFAGRSTAYAATNRLEEAERDVDNGERLIGDTALVHRARGLIALRRSNDTEAIKEFTAALSKDPRDKLSLYFRASLFQEAHKEVAALADAETFVEADPRTADGYVLRGRILVEQQKFTIALLDADRLVRLFPDRGSALVAAADIYSGAGDRQRALQAIDRAIAIEPNSDLYRFMRSEYRQWNDFAGRRADLEAALKLDPGNLNAVTRLAQLDFKQHRWSDAAVGFSKVLDTDSSDYGALAYRAMSYLNLNEPSLAQSDRDKALQLASGPDDLNNICWAFASEGYALDWALEACNRALEVKPEQSRYLANRAMAELRLGRLDRALADYNHSVASNAKEARAYFGRSIILSRQGKVSEARDDRKHARDLDPSIDEVFEGYGFVK